MKRIVQKEDSRLGKLLEKIRGKKEPTNNVIKKEQRVHIKWKQRDPIKQMDTTVSLKKWGTTPVSFVVRKIQLLPLNRKRLNYTF